MNRDADPRDMPDPVQSEARPTIEERSIEPPTSREPDLIRMGGYTYQLSSAELQTMHDIGRFRAVSIGDLTQFRYHGKTALAQQDLRALRAQGLVQLRTVWSGPNRERFALAVLTKLGKKLIERQGQNSAGQVTYAGFVKPAEVRHDTAIYRMFQAEKQKIERSGGTIRRIILDFELKQKVYSPLAKAKSLGTRAYAERQAEVARENGLTVVEGKIPLPDLRIEYTSRGGELSSVDLELTTEHYHGSALQAKAEAGFKMYAPADSTSKLSRVLEERDIIATILSL